MIGSAPPRTPPREVQFLLPVWGERYIRQFLTWSLPTFLSPGNIPAVARDVPCRFVFLTSAREADFLRDHRQYRRLAAVCEVEMLEIDDLITGDNYSTTITLAY